MDAAHGARQEALPFQGSRWRRSGCLCPQLRSHQLCPPWAWSPRAARDAALGLGSWQTATGFACRLLLLLRAHCWAKGVTNREALGSRSVDAVSFDTHADVGAVGSWCRCPSLQAPAWQCSSALCLCLRRTEKRGREGVPRRYSKTE